MAIHCAVTRRGEIWTVADLPVHPTSPYLASVRGVYAPTPARRTTLRDERLRFHVKRRSAVVTRTLRVVAKCGSHRPVDPAMMASRNAVQSENRRGFLHQLVAGTSKQIGRA